MLPLCNSLFSFPFWLSSFKMHTFEIVARRTTTNSSICEIEIQRTRTEHCSKHWFIVFRCDNGENISAQVSKKQDAEWTWNIDLHPFKFVTRFNITDKGLQIQDLATIIYISEGHSSSKMAGSCHCSEWV